MERYLEFRIDEQTTELKMEAFLKKNAGLTKRQISQAKFRPDGITRNGVRCRVTETIYPGDVIRVCLEEAGTASAHLENYNDGIRSKDLSDFHSNRASASISETSFSLNILYEDTDILAVDKPAGMVTHPTGMHYTDSLSNLVAGYFREKNEQVCVRPVGRLDQETSGIVVFAKNQVAASRLQSVKSPCKIHKQYLAAVSDTLPVDMPGVWHTLDLPLMQDPENHLKMKTAADLSLHSSALSGKIKTAVTHYHTLFPVRTGRLSHLSWIPDVPTRSVSIWHPQDILCLEILFIIQTIKYLPVLPFPGQPFMHGKFLFSILSEMKCSFWKHHYLSIFVNWFHFQGLTCCLFKLQIL